LCAPDSTGATTGGALAAWNVGAEDSLSECAVTTVAFTSIASGDAALAPCSK
jgi:hypothetical protein